MIARVGRVYFETQRTQRSQRDWEMITKSKRVKARGGREGFGGVDGRRIVVLLILSCGG